jgi:hypothetical protein
MSQYIAQEEYTVPSDALEGSTFSIGLVGGQPGEILREHASSFKIATEGRKLRLINLPDEYKKNPHKYTKDVMEGIIDSVKLAPHEIGVIALQYRNEKQTQVTIGAPTGKLKTVDGTHYTSMPSSSSWKSVYVAYDQNGKELHTHNRKNDIVNWAKKYMTNAGLHTSLTDKIEIRMEQRLDRSNLCTTICAQTKDTTVEMIIPANHFIFFGKREV